MILLYTYLIYANYYRLTIMNYRPAEHNCICDICFTGMPAFTEIYFSGTNVWIPICDICLERVEVAPQHNFESEISSPRDFKMHESKMHEGKIRKSRKRNINQRSRPGKRLFVDDMDISNANNITSISY